MQGGDMSSYVITSQTPLTPENYNELDALVFAELSYCEFENIEGWDSNSEVSVSTFAHKLLENMNDNNKTKDSIALLQAVENSSRYENCTVSRMEAANSDSQWAAMTVSMNDKDGSSIIAMRGTNGTTLGWTEDFELAYAKEGTNAQKLSAEYLKNAKDNNIYLTGHSKGGNDIMSAYILSDQDIRNRVVRLDNYDGPGFNEDFIDRAGVREAYGELDDKLNNYYPKDSLIGKLLRNDPGNSKYIETDTDGHTEIPILGEHDPFSFKIENGELMDAGEASRLSDFLDVVLDKDIEHLSNKEREALISAVVALGVPALIAQSKEDSPYKDCRNTFETIEKGLGIYLSLKPNERHAVEKTLGLSCKYAVETGKKMIKDDVEDFISASYHKVNNIISDFSSKAVKELEAFSERVIEKVYDFNNWLDEKGQDFKTFIDNLKHGASSGRSIYEVDPSGIIAAADIISSNGSQIRNCRSQIADVRHELSPYMRAFVGGTLIVLESRLSSLSSKTDRQADALRQIGQCYKKTEASISGFKI